MHMDSTNQELVFIALLECEGKLWNEETKQIRSDDNGWSRPNL